VAVADRLLVRGLAVDVLKGKGDLDELGLVDGHASSKRLFISSARNRG